MSITKLHTETFFVEAAKSFLNIAVNRSKDFIVYVDVVKGPTACKASSWDSAKCWFSHMLATKLSINLKDGSPFNMTYTKTMLRLLHDMRSMGYTEAEIQQFQFSLTVILTSNNMLRVYNAGDNILIYQLASASSVKFMQSHSELLTCNSKAPEACTMEHVSSFTICNKLFADACIRTIDDVYLYEYLHNVSYYKLNNYIDVIRKDLYDKCDVAYCCMVVH